MHRRSEESGLQLAQAYRHGAPPRMLVNAFKHQLGWRLLDQQSRLSVQELLMGLVERVGGEAVTFDYRRAIEADFAVEPETSVAATQRRADLARLPELLTRQPELEDELRDTQRRLHSTEQRLSKLRAQYDELLGAHDRMVNDHEAERTSSRVWANRLSSDVQELASRLLAPQPVAVRRGRSVRDTLPPPVACDVAGPSLRTGEAGRSVD